MSKLETRAVVIRIDGQHAMVMADQADGCEQCAGKGCGAGKLSRLFCSKPRQFQVINPVNAGVGDEVIVSVAEGAVMRGIVLVYLMPLVLLLIGAALGNWLQLGQSDSYAAAGAMSGLVVGFAIARWLSLRQGESRFQPYIARHCQEKL
ncbi:MAG: SoxR reducing system RseC family protein [Pseudomonadota bacterium]